MQNYELWRTMENYAEEAWQNCIFRVIWESKNAFLYQNLFSLDHDHWCIKLTRSTCWFSTPIVHMTIKNSWRVHIVGGGHPRRIGTSVPFLLLLLIIHPILNIPIPLPMHHILKNDFRNIRAGLNHYMSTRWSKWFIMKRRNDIILCKYLYAMWCYLAVILSLSEYSKTEIVTS